MRFRHLTVCLLLVGLPLFQSWLAADELPVWTPIGPDGGGNVQALAVSPALPNAILAGVPNGFGIFRSADRGMHWGAATDAGGRNVLALAIGAKGGAFFAATSRGLLRSTDGGVRWPALDASPDVYTLVATHPRKPAVLFAVRGGVLLRSTNGGVARQAVEGPEGVEKIAFALIGQRTVVYAGAANGLWRSADDGRTWTDTSPSIPSPARVKAVAVDPFDPRIVYIGLQQGRRVLLKSRDGGATWRLSQNGLAVAGHPAPTVSELAVDRANPSIVFAVAGGQLFRSLNGGLAWSRPVPELPGGFVNALETTGYGVLAGTSAGVLLSVDRGLTWQLRTDGMSATSIAGMAIDQQEPARLYASTVSGGLFMTADRGRPWLRLSDLASSTIANRPLLIDPTDPDILYAITSGGILKSTDGGRTWASLLSSSCLAFSRFALDPREPAHMFTTAYISDPQRCYVGGCTSARSLDGGATWDCIGTILTLIYGDALAGVDPFTSAVYAQAGGHFWRSADNGTTWTVSDENQFGGPFAASPLVAGTLWAAQGSQVMRSRDGGQTWQFFLLELPPGESLVDLAPDPVDPATLYAATGQSGVIKSTDAGETWSQAGLWPSGLRYKGGLLVDPGDPAIVYAGTEGASVMRLDQSGD